MSISFHRLVASTFMAGFLLIPSLAMAQSDAKDGSKVLAIVNGEAITQGEAELALEDLQTQYPNIPPERAQSVAVEFLIDVKLAAQAAKRAKIEESEAFKSRLSYARDRILMERVLVQEVEKNTGDAALKTYYDQQIALVKPQEEVRARHILVENEDEAKKIAARLKAGEDFAKIAAEASKDPGSGKEGGDLGFFTKDKMVSDFAEAAFALKPGAVSAPVKSEFGWHIIKLEERRTKPVPTFEEVKDRLVQGMGNKIQSEFVARQRSEAKIEMKIPVPEAKKN